ncbi:MAG: peptidoglycan-binding domain-containing protein [Pseudomonadota bacterium]
MANLKRGDKGSKVKQLQRQLRKVGTTPRVGETGTFCPLTDQAVRDFQRRNKLKVDGIVGPITRAALDDYFEKDVKWTLKDTSPIYDVAAHIEMRELKRDTNLRRFVRKTIGTKDKLINGHLNKMASAMTLYDITNREMLNKLGDVKRIKEEFDRTSSKRLKSSLLADAKALYAECQKLSKKAEKDRRAYDALATELEEQLPAKAA